MGRESPPLNSPAKEAPRSGPHHWGRFLDSDHSVLARLRAHLGILEAFSQASVTDHTGRSADAPLTQPHSRARCGAQFAALCELVGAHNPKSTTTAGYEARILSEGDEGGATGSRGPASSRDRCAQRTQGVAEALEEVKKGRRQRHPSPLVWRIEPSYRDQSGAGGLLHLPLLLAADPTCARPSSRGGFIHPVALSDDRVEALTLFRPPRCRSPPEAGKV